MKKLAHFLFAFSTTLILSSCSKEGTKQIDDPIEIKDNVLVKQITRTDEQGFVQTVDFKYEGNKIISIETEQEKIKFGYSGNLIIKKEVYNKTYANTETFNYDYNGKILSTMNTLSFIKYIFVEEK
jgi:S-adenosylmethionine hydrolase